MFLLAVSGIPIVRIMKGVTSQQGFVRPFAQIPGHVLRGLTALLSNTVSNVVADLHFKEMEGYSAQQVRIKRLKLL